MISKLPLIVLGQNIKIQTQENKIMFLRDPARENTEELFSAPFRLFLPGFYLLVGAVAEMLIVALFHCLVVFLC